IATGALNDSDARVKAAAIRLCEPYLVPATREEVLPEILKLLDDQRFEVKLQLALSLSAVPDNRAEGAVAEILERDGVKPLIREAAITGMRGRELEFLEKLLFIAKRQDCSNVVQALSQCVMNERRATRVKKLLEIAARQENVVRAAFLEGMAAAKVRVVQGKGIFVDDRTGVLDLL